MQKDYTNGTAVVFLGGPSDMFCRTILDPCHCCRLFCYSEPSLAYTHQLCLLAANGMLDNNNYVNTRSSGPDPVVLMTELSSGDPKARTARRNRSTS